MIGIGVEELRPICDQPATHYKHSATRNKDGSLRPLTEPDKELKNIQQGIRRCILHQLRYHEASHCAKGRSVFSHARVHLGRKIILTSDLQSAFPSISASRVRGALVSSGLSRELAYLITRLCTLHYQLPQGAPTSMALLNLCLVPMDRALTKFVRLHGWVYSRYADDLGLSGNHKIPSLVRQVAEIVGRYDMRLSKPKTRLWASGVRPTITGLILAREPSLSWCYQRQITSIVELCARGRLVLSQADMATLVGRIGWLGSAHKRLAARLLNRLSGVATAQ